MRDPVAASFGSHCERSGWSATFPPQPPTPRHPHNARRYPSRSDSPPGCHIVFWEILYGEHMDSRAGIRALRSAAAFDTTAAAATAHVSVRALRASLRRLDPRGACAAAVAEASRRNRVSERAAALAHQACPPPAARAAASDRSEQARSAASGTAGWAGRPLTPSAPRRAVAAAASGDLSAREQTAQTTTAGVVLCRLSTDHDGRVRTEVASNQSCSLRLLERLGEDPHHGVRSAVAANPNCPPATLKRLSEDSDGGVRHALAANEASPLELLEYLSNDSLGWVRHRVPCNPACPQPLLERLSSDPDAQMRKAVAANPECPRRLLKRLSRDTDADVRYQAHRTLKAPLTS